MIIKDKIIELPLDFDCEQEMREERTTDKMEREIIKDLDYHIKLL